MPTYDSSRNLPALSIIDFHGATLTTCRNEETGVVYCVPKEICAHLGVDWAGQFTKIKNNHVINGCVEMISMQVSGQVREMVLLDIEALPFWLARFDLSRIKNPASRERLFAYQKECRKALADYWLRGEAKRDAAPVHSPLRQAEDDLQAWIRIAELCDAPKYIALIEGAKDIQKRLGIDFSPVLQISAALDAIPDDAGMLEPTELGKRYGMSGRDMNIFLAKKGAQARIGGEWVPTDTGKEHCFRHAWKVGEKSGFNLKWNIEFVDRLSQLGEGAH